MNDLFNSQLQPALFQSSWQQPTLEDGQIHLHPQWLSMSQANQYYQVLLDTLAWRQDQITIFGKTSFIPRLQAWYGDSQANYQYSGLTMIPKKWTSDLLELKHRIRDYCQLQLQQPVDFNSVLANYYRDGADKMGYHSDDEDELGTDPVIASLSLGCKRRFVFKHKRTKEKLVLDLPPGSLLLMFGQTQQYYKHGIMASKRQLAGRINLTFRLIRSS